MVKLKNEQIIVLKAILLGAFSSFFLSSGLIVNSLMAFHSTEWAWTASLRFLLLIPILLVIVFIKNRLGGLWNAFKAISATFIIWGCLGFGVFYSFLTYAAKLAPGWLVAAIYSTTVLAGILISPFIYNDYRSKISTKALMLSVLLVISLLILQLDKLLLLHSTYQYLKGVLMTLCAAFLWPIGNRKVLLRLEQKKIQLDPFERILGMCLGGLPVLISLAIYGYDVSGGPTSEQLYSSFIAVMLGGLIGFSLFYKAMHMVKLNPIALSTVEATQVLCVLFTLLAEMFFKGIKWPGIFADIGFCAIFLCLFIYSYLALKQSKVKRPAMINE